MADVFGNAWDFMHFDEMNCCRCALYDAYGDKCDIQAAMADAQWGDGTIPDEIAARMGWTEDRGIPRRCAEFVDPNDSAEQGNE